MEVGARDASEVGTQGRDSVAAVGATVAGDVPERPARNAAGAVGRAIQLAVVGDDDERPEAVTRTSASIQAAPLWPA